MRTTIKYLSAAGSCAMLLACAGGGQPIPPALPVLPSIQAADGYYVLGRNQYTARRYAAALHSYQQALRLDPQHINARNGLAVLHAGQGDYAGAIALWTGLSGAQEGASPHRAFLLRNLGYAYFLSGDHEQALSALEKACVLDPLNPTGWEYLGEVLEKTGQGERAALMFKQARTLQTHDVKADYTLARQALPDDMPRTEVSMAGGIAQLSRVGRPAPENQIEEPIEAGPLRLEIRNGNGVAGMAASLARTVAGGRLQVIRLANEKAFLVARTRVEYRPEQEQAARALASRLGPLVQAEPGNCKALDLRIVLGHDLTDPAALRRYYLQQLTLARGELARLD